MAIIPLLSYQESCFRDRPRFKVLMWARGARKTFTTTLEIADSIFSAESEGRIDPWMIASRGERQSLEAMREFKRHCRAYSLAASDITEDKIWSESEGRWFKVYEVTLPIGSRVLALPANPDTIRGYTGNVYLDEYDIHKDPDAIWKAAYPVLRGRYRMVVSSTPMRKGGRFYRLVTDDSGVWSKHIVDIYQAVAAGLPFNIELEKAALADPDAWAQEYELKWLDEASAWLSYELLSYAETDELEPTESGWRLSTEVDYYSLKECYLGWDIARRRDLSILWVVAREANKTPTVEICAMKGQRFDAQFAEFRRLMKRYPIRRACLDQTGMGEVVVEQSQDEFGSRVEGVQFSPVVKQDLAILLKQQYEDQSLTTPICPGIRDSLHSVKKTTTAAGNFRFDAERTDLGHADYFWAQALAVHGASNPSAPVEFRALPGKRLAYNLNDYVGGNWRDGGW